MDSDRGQAERAVDRRLGCVSRRERATSPRGGPPQLEKRPADKIVAAYARETLAVLLLAINQSSCRPRGTDA